VFAEANLSGYDKFVSPARTPANTYQRRRCSSQLW